MNQLTLLCVCSSHCTKNITSAVKSILFLLDINVLSENMFGDSVLLPSDRYSTLMLTVVGLPVSTTNGASTGSTNVLLVRLKLLITEEGGRGFIPNDSKPLWYTYIIKTYMWPSLRKCTFWLNTILKNELCLNSHHSDHLPINQVWLSILERVVLGVSRKLKFV